MNSAPIDRAQYEALALLELPRQRHRGERRYERQRQHERPCQREQDRERERPEHLPLDAAEREDRQVHHPDDDLAERRRAADLDRGAVDGLPPFFVR
jgi:hypothetical protein